MTKASFIQTVLENIPAAQALLKGMTEGGTLQFRKHSSDEWIDLQDSPLDIFVRPEHYRLRPGTKYVWANEYHGHSTIHESESAAKVAADPDSAVRVAVPCLIQEA